MTLEIVICQLHHSSGIPFRPKSPCTSTVRQPTARVRCSTKPSSAIRAANSLPQTIRQPSLFSCHLSIRSSPRRRGRTKAAELEVEALNACPLDFQLPIQPHCRCHHRSRSRSSQWSAAVENQILSDATSGLDFL